jgi:hypothetical protein
MFGTCKFANLMLLLAGPVLTAARLRGCLVLGFFLFGWKLQKQQQNTTTSY